MPSAADAQLLSSISKASKAYWGYPPEWLELWRADLEVTPEYLARHYNFVLHWLPDRKVIGFCVLMEEAHQLWVEHLWVLPDYIGRGLGSALLTTALDQCIGPNHRSVRVIADPNAVPFYKSKGFSTVDYHPSQPGNRRLPVMERTIP